MISSTIENDLFEFIENLIEEELTESPNVEENNLYDFIKY
jgi:hypothetical protein